MIGRITESALTRRCGATLSHDVGEGTKEARLPSPFGKVGALWARLGVRVVGAEKGRFMA
jgi:hypothetical protein